MNTADCTFCKIVSGELPASKVYEDSDTLAFMDINPIIKGHILVIPKKHYNPITATPPEILKRLIVSVQKMVEAQMVALQADGVDVVQVNGKAAGQIIPHIHFHVIPRFKNDGHSFNWSPRSYANMDEMQEFAERIRNKLVQAL